jgi:hypothetical protein
MTHSSGEALKTEAQMRLAAAQVHVRKKLLTALGHMKHSSGEDIDDRGPDGSSDCSAYIREKLLTVLGHMTHSSGEALKTEVQMRLAAAQFR